VAEKKVAVVVVHGVADQQPSDSARQIANLLTDLCPLGTYSTFQEERIRVPVHPVATFGATAEHRSPFEERNHDAILRHRGTSPHVRPDQGFMGDQLRDYDPPDGPHVFETVRLDGERNDTHCGVHVYEGYWADLSRLGQGVFTFFDGLYQLLLHLPSLGRNAADYARAANNNARLWPLFSWLHRWSVRWLTLFLVVLNLTLASLALPLLVPRLTRIGGDPVGPGSTVKATPCCGFLKPAETTDSLCSPPVVNILGHAFLALAAIGLVAWLLHRRRPLAAWLWAVAPLLAAGAGWALADAICCGWGAARLLVFEAWALSAFLIALLLVMYERMRPGALLVGVILLVATGFVLFLRLSGALSNEKALDEAVIQVAQMVDIVVRIAWFIHVPWMLAAIVVGILCALTSESGMRRQAWNSVWTARFTLTLSTALFANLTLTVWAAVFKTVQKIVPKDAGYRPISFDSWISKPPLCLSGAQPLPPNLTINEFLRQTLMVSASRAFILITIVFAVFAIAAVWSILPSVMVESRPPKKQDSSEVPMRGLGVWLTRGLNFIPGAAEIFTVLFLMTVWIAGCRTCDVPPESSWKAISAAAALLLALIGARFWLPGARGALDIMLDVDNYLRQHPKNDTPRARIAERCASLIEFILKPERSGHVYDSVIIVAHSQGTAIIADLLRFLKLEKHQLSADLAAKNPAFFTMGNPIRQLYSRAFPGLYPWVLQGSGPTPDDLGIGQWINAYATGDYVGRFVWEDANTSDIWKRRNQNPQNVGEPTVQSTPAGTTQICIGEGAHTHYWDQHGGDIAWMLDQLIIARCGGES
jgi:hypothetical protein